MDGACSMYRGAEVLIQDFGEEKLRKETTCNTRTQAYME
jgi:hypothetical protein